MNPMTFTIKIPVNILPKSIKLKEGEKIDWSKKNLKEKSEQEVIVEVADELGIEPKDIFKHIKVELSQNVAEGDLLAEKKGMLSTSRINSPTRGEIRKIDHLEGTVTLNCEEVVDVPFDPQTRLQALDKIKQNSIDRAKLLKLLSPKKISVTNITYIENLVPILVNKMINVVLDYVPKEKHIELLDRLNIIDIEEIENE